MKEQKYYRINHPMVERAITDFNDGKIDAVELCSIIYQCHPYKWEHVIRWATESIDEGDWHDVLSVSKKDIEKHLIVKFIENNGLLMTPALKEIATGKILAWDDALSHDSIYFNYGLDEYEVSGKYEHGFITSKGVFLNRELSGKFAYNTRQWFKKDEPLYSRDAEQFSYKDLLNGEHTLYYREMQIFVADIPVSKAYIELLIQGANAQGEREIKEMTASGLSEEEIQDNLRELDSHLDYLYCD